MAAGRIVIPQWMPALSANGIPIPNAKIFFYQNNTTTLKTVYADEALTTPLANPVAANSAGHFPNIWGDDEELYSATVSAPYGPPGAPFTYDDLRPGTAAGGSSGVNRGAWNALTNTPALTDGTGEEGDFYTVSVAGITDLDGNATWKVGDQVLFKGGAWTRVPNKLGINLGYWDASSNIPVILPSVGAEGDFYTVSVPGNTVINGFSGWVVGDIIRFTAGMWVKTPPPYRRTVGTGTTVARPAYLKMGDRISIRDWLLTGEDDGVTPVGSKFQQAINEVLSAGKGTLHVDPGAVGYNIDIPLFATGQNPVRIDGTAPQSGFPTGSARQANLIYTGATAYPGSACMTFQTDQGNSASLRGVELRNLLIREPSNAMSGRNSGIHGVRFRGVSQGFVENVGVYGFARGVDWDDNPANADSSMVRCVDFRVIGLTVMNAAQDRVSIAGSAEIVFFKCSLGGTDRPGYRSDMRIARGTRGGRPDHVHAYSATFLGAAEHNLLIETGLFNNFQGCAFEGGTISNISVTTDTALSNENNFTMADCWIDGAKEYALDLLGVRFAIDNLRTQQLITAEGGTQSKPAVRVRGHASTPYAPLGSEFRGGFFSYSGVNGIKIENASNVSVIGGTFRNRVANSAPSIETASTTSRCDVVLPKLLDNAGFPVFGGNEHTCFTNAGIMVRGSNIARPLPPVTGTLDASGRAKPSHGVGNAEKIISAEAFSSNGAGVRRPIGIEYIDDLGVQLDGGSANASRAFYLYVTRIP